MGMMWIVLYLFLLPFFWQSVSAICYFPNGNLAANDVPCSSSGGNSTCCGFGYTCLSNNICKRSDFVNGNDTDTYVRGSCTDKTFTSSTCPSFCLENYGGGNGIAKCPNTSRDIYCCISSDPCSCDTFSGVIEFQGQPTPLTTIEVTPASSSASSSTSSITSSSTSALATTSNSFIPSQPTSSSTPPSSTGPSRSTKVGVGIGLTFGLLALIALIYGVWRLGQNRAQKNQPQIQPQIQQNDVPIMANHTTEAVEKPSTASFVPRYPQELSSQTAAYELPAPSPRTKGGMI